MHWEWGHILGIDGACIGSRLGHASGVHGSIYWEWVGAYIGSGWEHALGVVMAYVLGVGEACIES